jgi:hypothetical protein
MENKEELATIIAKRQWFNVPASDINNRIKGNIDYGDGRKVTGSDQLMNFWKAGAPIPSRATSCGSSPRTSAGASCRWTSTPRRSSAKVNREDLWREAAKNISAAEADIPKTHVARQGDLLRRQGVRSGRSQGLPRLAADQEGGVMAGGNANTASIAAAVPVPARRRRSCRSGRRCGRRRAAARARARSAP